MHYHLKSTCKSVIIWLQILTQVVGTCLGLILVIFLIARIIPIDPVLAIVGSKATATVYEAQKHALGLDLPIYKQFINYLIKIMQGDFGYSLLTSNLVLDDIKRVFPATIELATTAALFGVLLGVPIGILSAVYQDSWVDHTVRLFSLLGNSISIFWLALMGLLLFYAKLAWFPEPGRISFIYSDFNAKSGFVLLESLWLGKIDVFVDALQHILLPAIILAYYNLSHISRMTRLFMLEQLNQEYVLTARIKGLSEWRIIWVHVLRNAAIPLITVIILSYGSLLEGSTFVETIFLWPGLGYYLNQSLMNADLNATLGCTLIIGLIFIGFNILADYLYKILDPRVK
jgi:peptide/nickel transport system permease protein